MRQIDDAKRAEIRARAELRKASKLHTDIHTEYSTAIVGERVRSARVTAFFTQDDVAALLGVTRTQYTNIEGGRSDAPTRALKRLCIELDVSADWLLGLTDTRHIEQSLVVPPSDADDTSTGEEQGAHHDL